MCKPWSYEERVFYGEFIENSESKLHISCICLERLSFHLCMQPKIISKCISFMTFKRQDLPILRQLKYGRI